LNSREAESLRVSPARRFASRLHLLFGLARYGWHLCVSAPRIRGVTIAANSYRHFDPTTEKLIKATANRLARVIGQARLNEDDLQQELSVHLLEQAGKFDASRAGWITFVTQVVRRKGVSILRHHHAQRRDSRITKSLDHMTDQQQGNRFEPTAKCQTPHVASPDLCLDMAQALESLDSDARPMTELLKHESVAEVARRLGLTRSEERTERLRIHELLTRLGLNVYCGD
jgi:RNA polymerase sigma factor (sigma-70 family)